MKTINKLFQLSFILVYVLFVVSCSEPENKEDYLLRFEKFVDRVGKNHEHYNKKDWEWANEQFTKYNKDYYLKFKGDYSIEDQIKIKSLIVDYHSFKKDENLGEMLRDMLEDDVEDIRKKVEEYLENDAEEDLEKLKEGAAEIGDSAIKVLEQIIEEIENNF